MKLTTKTLRNGHIKIFYGRKLLTTATNARAARAYIKGFRGGLEAAGATFSRLDRELFERIRDARNLKHDLLVSHEMYRLLRERYIVERDGGVYTPPTVN